MTRQIKSQVVVGRDRELGRLEGALLAARRGESRVVVVSGEAGVGKSRLVAELRARAAALGATVLFGECSATDLSLPYLPFVEAIGNHLAGDGVSIDQLTAALGSEARPLATLFPQLGADQAFVASDAPLDKLRLFEAMVRMLQLVAGGSALLLVIEDLHWSDRSTQELLEYVTRRMRTLHALVLVTHREQELDRRHPLLPTLQRWHRAGLSETIKVRPLNLDDVRGLVTAIFDVDDSPADFVQSLYARTDGVPFAIEELLRDAMDQGRLELTTEKGWDTVAVSSMPPPRSLADNILLRAERLSPEHCEVLRCAAVLGRSVEFTLLVEAAGCSHDAALDAVDACVGAQLLEEDPERDNAYRFPHMLIRDAVYDDMIVPRRRRLHGRAADATRALHPDEPAALAHHLIAAGRLDEAAPACARAGELAMHQLAPREACDLFQRALTHTHDPHELARLRCRLGEAWHAAGDVLTAQRHLEEGVTALEAAGDVRAAAHHRLSLGRCLWERSEPAAARVHYERARDDLDAAGPSEDLANAYLRLSGLHAFELDTAEAQRLADTAIAIAEAAGAGEAAIAARDWRGLALCDQGELDEGLDELTGAAGLAHDAAMFTLEARIVGHALSVMESYGRVGESAALLERLQALPADPWTQVVAPYYEGWVRFWSGALDAAGTCAMRCIATAQSFGMDAQVGWGRALLCLIETELGHLDEARELLPVRAPGLERQALLEQGWVLLRFHLAAGERAEAHALATELATMPDGLAGTALADTVIEALVSSGSPDDAAQLLEAVEACPRSAMHRGHLLRAQARVELVAGRLETALRLADQAAGVYLAGGYALEELRTRPLRAECQAGRGDTAGAEATLSSALADARACGAESIAAATGEVAARLGLAVTDAPPRAPFARDGDAVVHAPSPGEPLRTGERMVTVLFADVRGFTAMSRSQAPADMAERISTFQRWAALAVEQHHGIVDKFAGDALMATFNARGWHVDHTRHALEVALSLVADTALLQLPLGVGIAVGPAIVGELTEGANVTVLGTATNLASRLQAQAAAGEIVLSEDAYNRIAPGLTPAARVEPCSLSLKGFDEPVRAFRLTVEPG